MRASGWCSYGKNTPTYSGVGLLAILHDHLNGYHNLNPVASDLDSEFRKGRKGRMEGNRFLPLPSFPSSQKVERVADSMRTET